jgi:hypothetical protein
MNPQRCSCIEQNDTLLPAQIKPSLAPALNKKRPLSINMAKFYVFKYTSGPFNNLMLVLHNLDHVETMPH